MITRGHTNHRCGKSHHNAKLTDQQVRAMRAMHVPGKVGYETLAREFGCAVSTARDICTYRTRYSA